VVEVANVRFHQKNIVRDHQASLQIALWAHEQAQHANSEVWLLGRKLVNHSSIVEIIVRVRLFRHC
jgi:hypothetical protein